MTTRRTVVITGGAGFIGSHLAATLAAEGVPVRVLDNFATGHRANLSGIDAALVEADVTDLDALQAAFADADVVYHLAALASVPRSVAQPLPTHHANVTGTLNVLLASRDQGVRRVVLAGSSSAYGDNTAPAKHEGLAPAPLSPYGVSKLAGEYYAQAFTHSYGLETVTLRFFNVFGPRQDPNGAYAAVIPRFITAMLRGQPPTIYGDGHQSRDFTYIANVVDGLRLAASRPHVAGRTFNLAMGGSTTLLELAAALNRLLGTQLAPLHAPARPGDILHSRADIALAQELLGYAPQVSVQDGLARTVAAYRAQQAAQR